MEPINYETPIDEDNYLMRKLVIVYLCVFQFWDCGWKADANG